MNFSLITLGELLSSHNETIRRNAFSILKQLQKERDTFMRCPHDWDRYGKCVTCGKWDIDGTRLD